MPGVFTVQPDLPQSPTLLALKQEQIGPGFVSASDCVCVVPREHENYTGALERIHTYEFFIGLEFEIFYTREKPTQPKQMTTNISWVSNDLESMMLFLSISVYLA